MMSVKMATIMIDESCGHCVRRWAEVVMNMHDHKVGVRRKCEWSVRL